MRCSPKGSAAGRGADVVGALIEPHGRRLTAEMAEGLEIVPRRAMTYRGANLTEMDLDAVLARHPQVALVDELAHTDVPGCRNAKRWQDVDELLDAGIEVITTLNIQHLAGLRSPARGARRPSPRPPEGSAGYGSRRRKEPKAWMASSSGSCFNRVTSAARPDRESGEVDECGNNGYLASHGASPSWRSARAGAPSPAFAQRGCQASRRG